jgi:hypothetical protein
MKYTIAACAALVGTQVSAGAVWSEREICRAATKTYFWLSDLPSDALDSGGYMGFASAEQNYYTCRVEGNVADLAWINRSAEDMRSRSTTFSIIGNALTVKSNMNTERFSKK